MGVSVNTGGRYDISSDIWIPMENTTIPSSRRYHTAIWTGAEMIIWGGSDGMIYFNTGSRFIPATGVWIPTSTGENVPSGRQSHTAIWDGSKMIIWGGYGCSNPPECNINDFLDTGGYYNPSSNSWSELNNVSSASARAGHTAVWTGYKMIIWGGYNSSLRFNTGGILEDNNWTPTSTSDPDTPSARTGHTAVWTGEEMIIWGGANDTVYYNDGAKFDPTKPDDEAWVPLLEVSSTFKCRSFHTAIWTGSEMVIWGRETLNPSLSYLNDGAYYNYQNNYWVELPTTTLSGRSQHSAIWTGTGMIVWGGKNASGPLDTGAHWIRKEMGWGGIEWRAPILISEENAPTPRYSHSVVWTGQEMIVWDGIPLSQAGGMYYPNTPPTAIPLLANAESRYSSSFHVPTCSGIESFCDSTNSSEWLLIGRDGVVEEPNTPNTLDYMTCLDGTGDNPHYNKFIDRIRIYTENGAKFVSGSKVVVEVTVVASSNYTNEYLDIYYTSNASSPS